MTGTTKDGYAKTITKAQLEQQRKEMLKICARSDIIITTALTFDKKAPLLITHEMIKHIRPGTVIIDMAVESGGNVEGSKTGKTINISDVMIIGHKNLAGTIPQHASQMYANNIFHMVDYFWDKYSKIFSLDLTDEILQSCLLTYGGKIVNAKLQKNN